MTMHRTIITLVLSALYLAACKDPSHQPPELEGPSSPILAELRTTLDSGEMVVALLSARYDSILPLNELDAMKTLNTREMAAENLRTLALMTDSLKSFPVDSQEWFAYEGQVRTQQEYVKALLASGKAILANNSQSFGKWTSTPKETGDSSTSQVAKPMGK